MMPGILSPLLLSHDLCGGSVLHLYNMPFPLPCIQPVLHVDDPFRLQAQGKPLEVVFALYVPV